MRKLYIKPSYFNKLTLRCNYVIANIKQTLVSSMILPKTVHQCHTSPECCYSRELEIPIWANCLQDAQLFDYKEHLSF